MAAIRAVLVKGRSSGDAVYAAAEETAKELKGRICQLHQIQKQIVNGSGTGISPARVMYDLCSPASQLQFWLVSLCEVHTFLQKPLYLLSQSVM